MKLQQINVHRKSLVAYLFVSAIFLIFGFLSLEARAQISPQEVSLPMTGSDQLFYTLGTRVKSNDLANFDQTVKVRPVIGLRYGRWQLGMGDGSAWRNLGQLGNEPTLSYQLLDEPDLNVGLSFRGHNVSTGESFDAFEVGKNTIRTRVIRNRKISSYWRMNLDWTQDILNKGDSTTLNLGLSYVWPVYQQSELILHADSTWATAEHWRNSGIKYAPSFTANIPTGFEKVSAGFTFKQSLTKHWAWYTTFAYSQPIAELRKSQYAREIVSGQIGILYFQR
jgi:hypothetical protein